MFFRIIIICLVLAGAYALYEIIAIQRYYAQFRNSPAEFAVLNNGNHPDITIVEFMNYDCGMCKDTHLALLDYARANPDVSVVVRPVPFANNGAETAAERALAAGLQGKFAELDRALAEYKGELNDKFYRESAAVYDIDYERMVREAEEENVQVMAGKNARAVIVAGLKTTPALMIGKTFYETHKALTLADLTRMVDDEKRR